VCERERTGEGMRECVGVGVGEREWVCARESKRERKREGET